MASFVGKLVAKKLIGGKRNKKDEASGQRHDIEYNSKWKKTIPRGLTPEEARILTKAKGRAYSLDMCLKIPCVGRFGWSSVVGLIPVVGDVFDLLLALMLIRFCDTVEPKLPPAVKFAMFKNLAFDFALGLVPLLGDIVDAVYKSNTKNVVLFEEELVRRAEKRQMDGGRVVNQAAGEKLVNQAAGDRFAQKYKVLDNGHEQRAPGGSAPRYPSTKTPRNPEQVYDPVRSQMRAEYSGAGNEVDLEAGEVAATQQPRRQQTSRSNQNHGRVGGN